MKELTFENVKDGDFELVHKIPQEVGERYESLTSFRRGRDFNAEVMGYMIQYVNDFHDFLNEENKENMNERLVKYNKLVTELRTDILRATSVPSVMISGGSNFPAAKKRKEVARLHSKESELYSNDGKHARFLDNTRKMYDPVIKEQQEKTEQMRKDRAEEKGWKDFFAELDHEELEGYGIDLDNNRVFITTHGKPSNEVRSLLKKGALRWSPRNERWQRILTENAINSLIWNVFSALELEVTKDNFE